MVVFFSRNCKRDILPIRLSSLHLDYLRKVTQDNEAMQHGEPKPDAQFAVIQSERKEFRNPGGVVPAVAAGHFQSHLIGCQKVRTSQLARSPLFGHRSAITSCRIDAEG